MKLPSELTTVTLVSKSLALIMIVCLPIIGFFFGRYYQRTTTTNEAAPDIIQLKNTNRNTIIKHLTATPMYYLDSDMPPPPNTDTEAFLIEKYEQLKSEQKLTDCHDFNDCFKNQIPFETRAAIALKYKVIDPPANPDYPISIGLIRGRSATYTSASVKYLSGEKWYWVVGSCDTNKRVFIDAETGMQTGPLHTYVYCTSVNEMEEPFDM